MEQCNPKFLPHPRTLVHQCATWIVLLSYCDFGTRVKVCCLAYWFPNIFNLNGSMSYLVKQADTVYTGDAQSANQVCWRWKILANVVKAIFMRFVMCKDAAAETCHPSSLCHYLPAFNTHTQNIQHRYPAFFFSPVQVSYIIINVGLSPTMEDEPPLKCSDLNLLQTSL